MGVCTAFVFAALVEFTFVNYMWRSQSIREGKRNKYDQGGPSMMKGKQHRESRARTNSFFPCLERQESLVELDMVIYLTIYNYRLIARTIHNCNMKNIQTEIFDVIERM